MAMMSYCNITLVCTRKSHEYRGSGQRGETGSRKRKKIQKKGQFVVQLLSKIIYSYIMIFEKKIIFKPVQKNPFKYSVIIHKKSHFCEDEFFSKISIFNTETLKIPRIS